MTHSFKDLFISYGRRESLGFVGRLHQRLKLAGYDAWFDKVNIPDGDDYAQRINHGIESAHNFVYIMAPRCLTSPYCLMELEYARLLGKRVIPINHQVIFNTPKLLLSAAEQQFLVKFYRHHNLSDQNIRTTHDILIRSHDLVGKTDWLEGKEKLSDEDYQRLAEWAQSYENVWAKHDDLEYLKLFEFPKFGHSIDVLSGVVERIKTVLDRQKDYVYQHTEILAQALRWQKNHKATYYLLVGEERLAAEKWLLTEFIPPKQPPCQPGIMVCDFICEARKNVENMMTDVFICYDIYGRKIRDKIIQLLSRYAVTTWTDDHDIQKGARYQRAVEVGIENADNFFYFISPTSVRSDDCLRKLEHALRYHKRIIPLLIAPTPVSDIPETLRSLQFIDMTDNQESADETTDYNSGINEIFNLLKQEQTYYKQHKVLLARALKWENASRKSSFLLRGYHLENAQTWLRLNEKRELHPPTIQHQELITASYAAKGQLGTDVFISYSRKDGDFARRLNTALQEAGKTTWFDQESMSSGVDFEKEIFKGIAHSDNFIFIISKEAVESEYCEREVNYAAEQNKRFITVLYRETDPATMPEALRVIHWIDFQTVAFETSFAELIQAIELDKEHAYQHTLLQQRATEWQEKGYDSDFLLNMRACNNAEIWLRIAEEGYKQPTPTALQQKFIQQSRLAITVAGKKARRRRRIAFAAVTMGMIIASILAVFAFVQKQRAEEQAKIAVVRQLGAQALIAAQLPSPSNGYFDRALLLAAQGFQMDKTVGQDALLRMIQTYPKLKRYIYGHTQGVTSVAISPNGKWLASGSQDNTIRFWDVEAQVYLAPLEGHSDNINSIAFSPSGMLLASGSLDKTIRLWDVKKQAQLGKPLTGHNYAVESIAFSPSGKLLASGSLDRTVRLWDVEKQTQLGKPLTGHHYSVNSVIFSPSGKLLASGSYDKSIRLWHVETQAPVGKALIGHGNSVESVAFNPSGKLLVSGSRDKTIRLWHVETQTPIGRPLRGHSDFVESVVFHPTKKLLASGSRDKTIRLWNINDTQAPLSESLIGHDDSVESVAFSPSGKLLTSGSLDKTIRLWDIEAQTTLSKGTPLTGHKNNVNSVAFSPSGKLLASGSYDRTIRLWDIKTQTLFGEPLTGHNDGILSVAFSPSGKFLASGSFDQTIQLWNVDKQTTISTLLVGHNYSVESVAFNPSSKLLASASAQTIQLWNIETQTPLGKLLTEHDRPIQSIVFNTSGKLLASGSSDQTIRLWNIETQTPFGKPLIGHDDEVLSVAFSPSGKILASGSSDQTIRLWDVKTQTPIGEPLTGHDDEVSSVAFSPSGKLLASGSFDQTIRLWDVEAHSPLGEPLKGHLDGVLDVTFSPSGKMLASGSSDQTIRLWNIDPQSWLKKACQIANRNLSQAEWQKYFGNELYQKTCKEKE